MKTVLFDATQLAYVAFYSEGLEGAENVLEMAARLAVGMLSRVLRIGMKVASNRVVMCWDHKASKRREIYPEYKATRHRDDSEEKRDALRLMYSASERLRDHVFPEAGFLNQWQQEGIEADDLQARGALDLSGAKIIVSSDEDMLQCLRPDVWLFHPSALYYTTLEDFTLKYGIEPEDWARVKAIAGCDGDNVPGVAGVAETTAARFLRGELKQGTVKWNAIVEQYNEIMARLPLVQLPFAATAPVQWKRNALSISNLKAALSSIQAGRYLFDDRQLRSWQAFIDGDMRDYKAFQAAMRSHFIKNREAGL